MKINDRKLLASMFRKGFNIGMLSKESKISRATISAVKSGKSCSYQTAFKIAKALDVDVTELLED